MAQYFRAGACIGTCVGLNHASLTMMTSKQEEICVQRKYKSKEPYGTTFWIETSNGDQKRVGTCVWFGTLSAEKLWNNLQEGKTYEVNTTAINHRFTDAIVSC